MGYYLQDNMSAIFSGTQKTHTPVSPTQERGLRFYNPGFGRWMSRDPIGEWSVLKSLLERTSPRKRRVLSWASYLPPYLFAYNRPIDHFDPDGLYGNPVSGPEGPVGPGDPSQSGGPYNPIPSYPADPTRGVLSAVFEILNQAWQMAPPHGASGPQAHCVASCRISKAGGQNLANALGQLKEYFDQWLNTVVHFSNDEISEAVILDSAQDLLDNATGRACATDICRDCVTCCKEEASGN